MIFCNKLKKESESVVFLRGEELNNFLGTNQKGHMTLAQDHGASGETPPPVVRVRVALICLHDSLDRALLGPLRC